MMNAKKCRIKLFLTAIKKKLLKVWMSFTNWKWIYFWIQYKTKKNDIFIFKEEYMNMLDMKYEEEYIKILMHFNILC